MGGHFFLRIFEDQDLPAVAEKFQGLRLATALSAGHSLYDCELSCDVMFMIGNEGSGLSKSLLSYASDVVSIPMLGKVESLNAASAAAICLFEAVRQKLAHPASGNRRV
jgi:TrmH family RNA methyltransferase